MSPGRGSFPLVCEEAVVWTLEAGLAAAHSDRALSCPGMNLFSESTTGHLTPQEEGTAVPFRVDFPKPTSALRFCPRLNPWDGQEGQPLPPSLGPGPANPPGF